MLCVEIVSGVQIYRQADSRQADGKQAVENVCWCDTCWCFPILPKDGRLQYTCTCIRRVTGIGSRLALKKKTTNCFDLRKAPLAVQFRCKVKQSLDSSDEISDRHFPFYPHFKKKNSLEPFRDKFTYYIDKDPIIWLEYCRYGVKHKSVNQQNELESTDLVNSLTKKNYSLL